MQNIQAIRPDDSLIDVDALDSGIQAAIDAGGYAIVMIATAFGTETIVVRGYDGTNLSVLRDNPQAWPAFSSIATVSTSNTPLQPDNDNADIRGTLEAISAEGPLTVEMAAPGLAPTLRVRLQVSGVAPGVYGGLTVDQWGRITAIDPQFPRNSLPVWNPFAGAGGGGGGGGGGGADDASEVAYTPAVGATVVTSGNLQGAVQQLEAAVVNLQLSATDDVNGVLQGNGISITGASTLPQISLATSGISPGTYAGFQIDVYGRVIGYSAVAANFPAFAGTAPISVSYSADSNTYSFTVSAASSAVPGVVKISDHAQTANDTVSDPSTVPDFQGVKSYVEFKLNAEQINNRSAGTTATPVTAVAEFYNPNAARVEKGTLQEIASWSRTAGMFVTGTQSLASARNVQSFVRNTAGSYTFNCTNALPTANYHVNAAVVGSPTPGGATTPLIYVTRPVSQTQFIIEWYLPATGALTDPPQFSFSVEPF